MYHVYWSKKFEKSYKRIKESGKLKDTTQSSLDEVVVLLVCGEKLPKSYRDHQLTGELKEYRECHIRGDLLLVYQIKKQELILVLVDLGSHSYLKI